MFGWTQLALTIVISIWGSLVGVSTTPGSDEAPPCEACHPEEATVLTVSPQRADTAVFTHERHLPVNCESCHVGVRRPNPRDYGWCDSCHHRPQSTDACDRCHGDGPDPSRRFELLFELPGGPEPRPRAFPHESHREVQECESCHGDPPGPVEEDFTCASCHVEHHESETVDCLGCHEPPPTWAHEDVVVHQTCAGGVCHKAFEPGPLEGWPRSACEACHQDFRGVEELPEVPERLRPDTSAAPPVRVLPTDPSV